MNKPDIIKVLGDIETMVAGTSFRQENVKLVKYGDFLELVPDPHGVVLTTRFGERRGHNDPTAVMLLHEDRHVGYIPKEIANEWFNIASKTACRAFVAAVVGGTPDKPTVGLRVVLPHRETGENTFSED